MLQFEMCKKVSLNIIEHFQLIIKYYATVTI
jgi:hypothetical protein